MREHNLVRASHAAEGWQHVLMRVQHHRRVNASYVPCDSEHYEALFEQHFESLYQGSRLGLPRVRASAREYIPCKPPDFGILQSGWEIEAAPLFLWPQIAGFHKNKQAMVMLSLTQLPNPELNPNVACASQFELEYVAEIRHCSNCRLIFDYDGPAGCKGQTILPMTTTSPSGADVVLVMFTPDEVKKMVLHILQGSPDGLERYHAEE